MYILIQSILLIFMLLAMWGMALIIVRLIRWLWEDTIALYKDLNGN